MSSDDLDTRLDSAGRRLGGHATIPAPLGQIAGRARALRRRRTVGRASLAVTSCVAVVAAVAALSTRGSDEAPAVGSGSSVPAGTHFVSAPGGAWSATGVIDEPAARIADYYNAEDPAEATVMVRVTFFDSGPGPELPPAAETRERADGGMVELIEVPDDNSVTATWTIGDAVVNAQIRSLDGRVMTFEETFDLVDEMEPIGEGDWTELVADSSATPPLTASSTTNPG